MPIWPSWPSGKFLDEKRRIILWMIPLSWWGQNLICLGGSSLWTYEELNKDVGGRDIFGSYLRGRSDCSVRQFQLTTVRELQLPCLLGQMWPWVSHWTVVQKNPKKQKKKRHEQQSASAAVPSVATTEDENQNRPVNRRRKSNNVRGVCWWGAELTEGTF